MELMKFATCRNDPRLCDAVGVGTCTDRATNATTVAVAMLRARTDEEAAAFHLCTPAEARQMAFELWEHAEKADRAMDAAVQGGKGDC